MKKGVIKWYDSRKGYGFIAGDDGTDVFFHVSQMSRKKAERPRAKGKVTYELSERERKPIAINIVKVEE